MRLCVIGDPVGHSLSPRIHRRFMERCGAAGSYEAVTVTAEALEDFVVQGRRGAWDGCNVTMPLKERILPLLDAFLSRGQEALVADSRVKDFQHPRYTRLGLLEACTWPDLAEPAEFRNVSLYHAKRS